jgi:N-acetylmuramoyl-L-alanine amidase
LKLRTLLLIALFFLSQKGIQGQANQDIGGINTIVLDAGHGGYDPGNLGTGRYTKKERDITLDVTLRLGEYIKENLPEVRVVFTRTTNKHVTLERRAEIANEVSGDLFVSIHCDAFTNSTVFGSTSIVLGKNHGDENRIALQENSAILLEENYEKHYEGFDPNNPMSYIGLNLMQQTYLNESVALASLVQEQFRERVKRKDRGVKQQPLYVTSRTAMPAILIELGFLTNPTEEDFLNSERGQSYMASAIFRAIRNFKAQQDLLVADAISQRKEDDANTSRNVKSKSAEIEKTVSAKEKAQKTIKAKEKVEPQAGPIVQKTAPTEEIMFAVQILTMSSPKATDSPVFKGEKQVGLIEESGLYKYYVGATKNFEEAKATAKRMQGIGFKGAFVIGLENGSKISAVEARKKLP